MMWWWFESFPAFLTDDLAFYLHHTHPRTDTLRDEGEGEEGRGEGEGGQASTSAENLGELEDKDKDPSVTPSILRRLSIDSTWQLLQSTSTAAGDEATRRRAWMENALLLVQVRPPGALHSPVANVSSHSLTYSLGTHPRADSFLDLCTNKTNECVHLLVCVDHAPSSSHAAITIIIVVPAGEQPAQAGAALGLREGQDEGGGGAGHGGGGAAPPGGGAAAAAGGDAAPGFGGPRGLALHVLQVPAHGRPAVRAGACMHGWLAGWLVWAEG